MRAEKLDAKPVNLKNDPYVECRPGASGHAWDIIQEPVDAPRPKQRHGDPIFRRCLRCSTLRIDHVNALFKVAYRRYQHPEDYARKGLSAVNVRQESVRRVKRFKTDGDLLRAIMNKGA